MGTCHLSTAIKSRAAGRGPWEEFRVERGEARCAGGGGTGRTGLHRYFREPNLWAEFLYLLKSRRAVKILHGDDCSSWPAESFPILAETFWKNMCLVACTPTSPKSHIYCHSPYFFGTVSQNYLRCCLLSCSSRFAANKTSNSHVGYFFFKPTLPLNADRYGAITFHKSCRTIWLCTICEKKKFNLN